MEVTILQQYWDGYARDGKRALECFLSGERNPEFIRRILDLLHVYVDSPRLSVNTIHSDLLMITLARSVYQHAHYLGLWNQILYITPPMADIALSVCDTISYVEFMKRVGILHNNRGEWLLGQATFQQILDSTSFSKLPVAVKADVLHQFGAGLIRAGAIQRGARELQHCLELVEQYPTDPTHQNNNDQFGSRDTSNYTPLWETKAYALNQLGVAAMYQGQFDVAKRYFEACQNVLIAHHEANNLVCVAYQSMGRLLLYNNHAAQAVSVLEKGLNIRQKRRDQEGVAINSMYLAAAFLAIRQTQEVETLLNVALSSFQALGNHYLSGLCYLYLGQYECIRGNTKAALAQWSQALAVFAITPPPLIELGVLVRYLPYMMRHSQWELVKLSIRQLIRSKQKQELSLEMVIRLLI